MDFAEVACVFAELSAQLHADGPGGKAMLRAVECAATHVEGCDSASITLFRSTEPRTIAASDPAAAAADALQYKLGEGPCLQAVEESSALLSTDLTGEQRWPQWATEVVAQTPVRGAMCFRLSSEQAALNLFSHIPRSFSAEAFGSGAILASFVSSLLAQYEAEGLAINLNVALDSNRQIGTAIGILMAHHRITDDEAFRLLRAASQHLHIKLRTVAADVVHTGALPTAADIHDGRT